MALNILSDMASIMADAKKEAGGLQENLIMVEGAAREINVQFGGSRQRIQEIKRAVADATPELSRLGGTMGDVVQTLKSVSDATRKNVIASTEDVRNLFAASEVVGRDVSVLVENFTDIGVQFARITPEIQQSVNYIQSVGANTGKIFTDVLSNIEKLNQFNFSNGVEGLTRMATQASVLRFDMGQVFSLAESALKPERAVELASAFQRLGVSVGDLTDPFQLMYKSLMDPEGLQQAIVDMSSQFAFFNEETKQFEISPQGKLMMAEIGRETGLSAKEMSKLALSTADMDRKLSMLKPDISFASEEDKLLFANIAKMTEGGDYTVTIQDDKDPTKYKQVKLSELNNEQVKDLIELQKQAPKDLQEIQRAQLSQGDVIKGDVRAILQQLALGVVSSTKMMELTESMRKATTSVSSVMERSQRGLLGTTRGATDAMIGEVKDLTQIMAKAAQGNADANTKLIEKFTKLEEFGKKQIDEGLGSGALLEFQKLVQNKSSELDLLMKAMPATSRAELGGYKERLERMSSQTLLQIERQTISETKSNYFTQDESKINLNLERINNTIEQALKQRLTRTEGPTKVDHKLDIKDWNINIMASSDLREVLSTKNLKDAINKDEMWKFLFEGWERMSKEGR